MSVSAYSPDLSYIHDAGFGNFSREAGRHILSLLKRKKIDRCRVSDLGCGSGIWAELLAKNGFEVTGIDLSPEMVRIARRRVPSAMFISGSFFTIPIPRSMLITSLGESFNYLFDQKMNSKSAFQKLMKQCYEALEPGGLLIFDLLVWKKRVYAPYKTFTQGNSWAVLVEVNIDERKRILTRAITSFRKHKIAYRKTGEIHHAFLHDEKQIKLGLREIGFSVSSSTSYGRMKLRPGHVVFIAHKRREKV